MHFSPPLPQGRHRIHTRFSYILRYVTNTSPAKCQTYNSLSIYSSVSTEKKAYTTGELARTAGVSLRTIRWYTEAGLLQTMDGTCAPHRPRYDSRAPVRIQKIRRLAETGMKLSHIKELFDAARHIRATGKKRTLFLRKRLIEQRDALMEKERLVRQARAQIDAVLETTKRCTTCRSRGAARNCSPCTNLALLEDEFFGGANEAAKAGD